MAVGAENITADPAELQAQAHDWSWMSRFLTYKKLELPAADIAVRPASTEEVRDIVNICRAHRVPIIAYGAGTSVEGQILAVRGGVDSIEHASFLKNDTLELLKERGVYLVDLSRRVTRDELRAAIERLVADLLTTVPSLRALVTSRAPLRVRGEREYGVGPAPFNCSSRRDPSTAMAEPSEMARPSPSWPAQFPN